MVVIQLVFCVSLCIPKKTMNFLNWIELSNVDIVDCLRAPGEVIIHWKYSQLITAIAIAIHLEKMRDRFNVSYSMLVQLLGHTKNGVNVEWLTYWLTKLQNIHTYTRISIVTINVLTVVPITGTNTYTFIPFFVWSNNWTKMN